MWKAAAFALLLGCTPPATEAKGAAPPTVPVAVTPPENKASPALNDFLSESVEGELKTLQSQDDSWPNGYTADASLLKLERRTLTSGDKVHCTVLLTLLDATHSPVAIVRGNASALGTRGDPSLAREAVDGAARSAVSQLPSVFQQLQK